VVALSTRQGDLLGGHGGAQSGFLEVDVQGAGAGADAGVGEQEVGAVGEGRGGHRDEQCEGEAMLPPSAWASLRFPVMRCWTASSVCRTCGRMGALLGE